ncbi:CLUMA_CG004310, isoform A [Clunio marinus]|uniref:CLUMA_CG004310, isoform A n=1 Tax=Clunio marinus TaxID=568069 RepID=A0A1J1HRA7_9DIPT|nr:CLUMA_CG004310, isoform A [Clunio marinus]
MQEFTLDVNDILDENLMPVSLMLLDNESAKREVKNSSLNTLDEEFQCVTKEKINAEDGTLSNAFNSMGFHRRMINNFLCSKFVAEKILDEVQPLRMRNRLGVAANRLPEMKFMKNNSVPLNGGVEKSRMLFDEGSYEYKNWLAKTVTLEDINKNIEARKLRRQDQFVDNGNQYNEENYEEGDVTGFMVQNPLPNGGINSLNHFSSPQATAGAKTGYSYGPTMQQDYSFHMPPPIYHPALTQTKAIGIKDLFDIALTALAYLSFGLFMIQVVLCIFMSKQSETSVMLPIEMTADGAEVDPADAEVRVKRAIEKHTPEVIKQANIISKRTLQTMEAFLMAKEDRGRCLKKFICENNKFSKETFGIQKFTIPIFGISLSYISTKLNNFPVTATLDGLQASLVGLGSGDCSYFKCNSKTLNRRRK